MIKLSDMACCSCIFTANVMSFLDFGAHGGKGACSLLLKMYAPSFNSDLRL